MTGTFWQATQPVSGTFWQATQPVSGASGSIADIYSASPPTPYAGSGAATAIAEWEAIRQNSAGPLPAQATHAVEIGATDCMLAGVACNTGTGASGSGTQRVVTSSDSPGGAVGTPAFVSLTANATGGATGGHLLSAANNNATAIKASAGTLYSVTWEQTTTTLMDIRFYDTATAPSAGAPCNSSTNLIHNHAAQSNATSPGGHLSWPNGIVFASGIVVCVTGANADNDNTNAVTGLNLSWTYK